MNEGKSLLLLSRLEALTPAQAPKHRCRQLLEEQLAEYLLISSPEWVRRPCVAAPSEPRRLTSRNSDKSACGCCRGGCVQALSKVVRGELTSFRALLSVPWQGLEHHVLMLNMFQSSIWSTEDESRFPVGPE